MFKPILSKKLPNYMFSYQTKQKTNDIVYSFISLQKPIKSLLNATRNSKAKNVLAEIRSIDEIDNFNDKFISIKGKKSNFVLNIEDDGVVKIREKNAQTGRNIRLLQIKRQEIINAKGFGKNLNSVEKFLNDFYELMDFPLLTLKRKFSSKNISTVISQLGPKGVLTGQNAVTIKEIEELFKNIHQKLDSIGSLSTRNKIKNGYKKGAEIGQHGSKQLRFPNVGVFKEDFLINSITDKRSERHLVIRILPNNNKEPKNIIINSKGVVYKSKALSRTAKYGENAEFYSPEELDNYSFKSNLLTLKDELVKYNEYLTQKIEGLIDYQTRYSTSEKGSINELSMTLLKDIKQNFDILREKMAKIKTSEIKDMARKALSISTKVSSPAITFRNLKNFPNDLQVSFPILKDKKCARINILGYKDNIRHSYIVEDDALVKCNITNPKRGYRTDAKTYYYSNEEIEKSGLETCLNVLNSKLKKIVEHISLGQGWYKSKIIE